MSEESRRVPKVVDGPAYVEEFGLMAEPPADGFGLKACRSCYHGYSFWNWLAEIRLSTDDVISLILRTLTRTIYRS